MPDKYVHVPLLDPYFERTRDLFPESPVFLGYREYMDRELFPWGESSVQTVNACFYNHVQSIRWSRYCECGDHEIPCLFTWTN